MSPCSAHGKENRRPEVASTKPDTSPLRSPRRLSRLVFEPFRTFSVQAAAQTPQGSSSPSRASTRLRAKRVYEVSGSEGEKLKTPASQTGQMSRRFTHTLIVLDHDPELSEEGQIVLPQKRKAQEIVDLTAEDNDPLQQPDASKTSESRSTPSPPKLRKLTDVAPKPSDLAAALRVASFCGRRVALNGTANPAHVPIFRKASSYAPINLGATVPPKLRKVSEHAPKVLPPIAQRTEILESISSFSTSSGVQHAVPVVDPTGDCRMVEVDEIEYFSDDVQTQKMMTPSRTKEGIQAKRRTNRFSPLQLVNRNRPVNSPKVTEHGQQVQRTENACADKTLKCGEKYKREQQKVKDQRVRNKHVNPVPLLHTILPVKTSKAINYGHGVGAMEEPRVVTSQVHAEQNRETEPEPSQADQDDQSRGSSTKTHLEVSAQKCPLCCKIIPADDIMGHVDEELRVKHQETKEARKQQDDPLVVRLTKTYQTQEEHATTVQRALHQEDKFETANTLVTPSKPKQARDISSKDTPMRKTKEIALNSSFSGSTLSRDSVSVDNPKRKTGGMTHNLTFSGSKSTKDSTSLHTPMRDIGEATVNPSFLEFKQFKDSVSLVTPKPNIGGMAGQSPSSGSKSSMGNASTNTPASDVEGLTHKLPLSEINSTENGVDPFSLSSQNPFLFQPWQTIEETSQETEFTPNLDPFSLSSQNPFMMQPGQVIDSSAQELYCSTRPDAHKQSTRKERLRRININTTNMEQASPQVFVVLDDSTDDLNDLDDFMEFLKSALKLYQSFRANAKAKKDGCAVPKRTNSPLKAQNRVGNDTGRKGTIALNDSDDKDGVGEEASDIKSAEGASKAKSCILDRMLPLSASERRKTILKRRAARKSGYAAESAV
ncbi:hypothetical protein BGZ68_001182 [Mortierella alpina]|nr:hypothetical protein BGZ68_001182 [Mortierella alpina]